MSKSVKQKLKRAFEDPSQAILVVIASLRGWFIKIKYNVFMPNRVSIGKRFRAFCKIRIRGPGKVIIGDNVTCSKSQFKVPTIITHTKQAVTIIGNDIHIGGTQISCVNRVEIGDDARLASTLLLDSDIIPYPDMNHDTNWMNKYSSPIKIGKRAWLGVDSIVLKGVVLGDECVLSAGSVATQSAESYSLLMGNPARIIGKTGEDL